jgi:hypothetical protein
MQRQPLSQAIFEGAPLGLGPILTAVVRSDTSALVEERLPFRGRPDRALRP